MSEPLRFLYRNHRGVIAARRVRPDSVRWGSTEWHPEEGWLLRAFDLDKQAWRDFAMADMLGPIDGHLVDLREVAAALHERGEYACGGFQDDAADFEARRHADPADACAVCEARDGATGTVRDVPLADEAEAVDGE
jgi:hypothetical protein